MRATVHPISAFAVACTLALCACDTASKLPFESDPAQVQTIADLKRLCTGTTYRISQDITIQGVITGNDLYGEFSKTLVIGDKSGGICVQIDHRALDNEYPFGAVVTIHCNGLALGNNGGKIQLGTAPRGDYSVDRIARTDVGRYIRLAGTIGNPQPIRLRFDEVAARHIDTYVCFDNVQFVASGPWCDVAEETLRPEVCEREIADSDQNKFLVRIPGICIYATEPTPFGMGSIGGIIDYFDGKYTLRISNRNLRFTVSAMHPTAYP